MPVLTPIANWLIDLLYIVGMFCLQALPETPFQFDPLNWGEFGSLVSLIIPVQSMFAHMTLIVSAFLFYYAVRWLLRIIRQIQ